MNERPIEVRADTTTRTTTETTAETTAETTTETTTETATEPMTATATEPMTATATEPMTATATGLTDRPRERLWHRGVTTIGDEELLSILLGTGVRHHPVLAVASQLVRSAGSVAALSRASPRELSLITGVGAARAARIAAAFELGRRAVASERHRTLLGRPDDVFQLVNARVAGLAQELFIVIGMDIRNGLLDVVEVARGSVHAVEVHPREVFRPLVRMAAAAGVVVHNHPSGDPTPSPEDIALTRRLRDVGSVVGIPIIDHVVIGDGTFRSIAEWLGTEL